MFQFLTRSICINNGIRRILSTTHTNAKIPSNVHLIDTDVLIQSEKLFKYVKGDKLKDSLFNIKVLPGPFTNTVKETKEITLSQEVFRTDVRPDVMARVVRWQRNNAQQGTHSSKTKGEVSGTGKKPWRQKGTGRARQGSLRNPHFRGGGAAFGPSPRDHGHKLNKKERRLGLRSALVARLQEGKFFVCDTLQPPIKDRNSNSIENIKVPEENEIFVKTNLIAEYCEKLGLTSVVLVDDIQHETLVRACRNVRHIHYLPQVGLNVYSILRRKQILLSVRAVRLLENRLSEIKQRERRWEKRGWTKQNRQEKAEKDKLMLNEKQEENLS